MAPTRRGVASARDETATEELGRLLAEAETNRLRTLPFDDLRRLARLYRGESARLARLRDRGGDPDRIGHLNSLCVRAHAFLYSARPERGRVRSLGRSLLGGLADLELSSGDHFSVRGGGVMHAPGATLTVTEGALNLEQGAEYTLGGFLEVSDSGGVFTSSSTASGASLVVHNGAVLELGGAPSVWSSLEVQQGGVIRPTARLQPVDLRAGSLLVEPGGAIHADGTWK